MDKENNIYVGCCCLVAESYLTMTLWTVACQAPLSMGFPRQESWSGLPIQGLNLCLLHWQVGYLYTTEPQGSPLYKYTRQILLDFTYMGI